MVYDNNNYVLYQQNGGKVETDINSGSYTGPSINVSDKTIKMKIGLVKSENDDTLPSYLVPILECAKGDKSSASQTTSSSVMVTLSGNNLLQVKLTTGFTCEITSNFLTGTEKSAITIETYYQDSANAIVHNTIYFDESLLKSYDKDKNLTIQKNPFTADAKPSTDSSSEPSYTFTFDFETIITEIKNLPAYQLIQSMFKVAYNVPSGKSSTACLVKISDGAFLNLNFTGVPFNTDNISAKSDKNKLLLSISTTQATGIDGCIFKDILGELKLQDNLKQVLELKDYPIDCSRMAAPPSQKQPPVPGQTPPAQTESNSSSVTGVAPMTKTDSELTNIKESINKLLKQMNDLTSKQTNTQGQSTAMNQKFLVGAPGDKNVCGKGGIGLKSDGTIVSIQVPISLVMDEIMTPKMLEMYTSSNRQQASQKPSDKLIFSAAEQAVTDFGTAATDDKNAKKTAAEGKIDTATGLVAAAESAAQAAIDTAPKPYVDENAAAATIQALTDKLKKEATDVLDPAKIAYAAISPAPTPTIAFTTEHGLITTATAAITTATSADAAGKAAAIATATTAVESAIAAAKAADVAVKAAIAAAGKPAPPSGTGADYTAYETAYTAYDNAKQAFDSASSTALQTASDTASSAPAQTKEAAVAGDAQVKATPQQIEAAKAILRDGVKGVVDGISDDTKGIAKITTAEGEKQEEITKLTQATKVYTESLAKIKELQATYDAAVVDKNDDASKKAEADKIDEALGKIGKAIEEVTKANGLLDTAIGASQTADAPKAAPAPAAADDDAAAPAAAPASAAPAAAVSGDAAAAEAAAAEAAKKNVQAAISEYNTAKALAIKAAGEAAEAAKAVTDAAEAAQNVTNAVAAVQSDVSGYNTDSTANLTSEKKLLETLSGELQQLKASLEPLKPAQDEPANDAAEAQKAQEAATKQTYTDFYNTFKQCLVVGENENESQKGQVRTDVSSDNFLTTLNNCFRVKGYKDNEYKNINVKPFFEAVKAASLNSKAHNIDNTKFEGYQASIEGKNINHELLLAIIKSLEPNATIFTGTNTTGINKTSFEELIKSLTSMLSSEQNTLMEEIEYGFRNGGGFSLFDGGSNKPKSTTKSKSKHKSTPKSKPKNKTKKNHSKSNPNPNPNKSKTPKIKMNE